MDGDGQLRYLILQQARGIWRLNKRFHFDGQYVLVFFYTSDTRIYIGFELRGKIT